MEGNEPIQQEDVIIQRKGGNCQFKVPEEGCDGACTQGEVPASMGAGIGTAVSGSRRGWDRGRRWGEPLLCHLSFQ